VTRHRPDGCRAARTGRELGFASMLLLLAVVLAACAGQDQSGPPAARVTTWVAGSGGGAAIGTLRADVANIAYVLSRHEPAGSIRTACALLTNDAETAIGNLPTPDTRLTGDLDTAYSDAAAAGDDCYDGASGNRSLLERSARERAKLAPLLAAAIGRIEAITGRSPSTSTTAPVGNLDPFGG
jgi:hypothetical protein